MPGFFTNVICAPTSFPIGLIAHNLYRFDFCFDVTENETEINSEDGRVHEDQRVKKGDVISGSDINVLNQEFNNMLTTNSQSTDVKQITNQKVGINCDFTGIEDSGIADKKNSRDQKMYGCCPIFNQESVENIVVISEIKEEQQVEMVNKIKAKVTDTLHEQGKSQVDIDAHVDNMNKIQSTLISNVSSKVEQFIRQQSVSEQEIEYTDNMGICFNGRARVMEQKTVLDSLSINIITSSLDQIMKNDNNIVATTDTTVTRVSNWIILGSMILDLICIVICYFIIKTLIDNFNEI